MAGKAKTITISSVVGVFMLIMGAWHEVNNIKEQFVMVNDMNTFQSEFKLHLIDYNKNKIWEIKEKYDGNAIPIDKQKEISSLELNLEKLKFEYAGLKKIVKD